MPNLDVTDHELIRLLQRDGRLPYTQLAKTVGLSEAAVRQRVQRLIDSEVVQIVAVTDPTSLGMRRAALVSIKVDGDVQRVADVIQKFDEVVYLVMTAGAVDLICEVVVESDEALLHLLNNRIRSIPGVRSTETSMYLRLYKQTYQWGTK